MQIKHLLLLALLIGIAAAFAGCTGSTGPAGSAGTGTATASGASGSPNNLAVSPTDAIPAQNAVTIDVGEKDYLGNIPVTFQGGMGQIHVKKIDVTVYRSDGQVKTASIGSKKGDMAEIEGTKQPDRVVVYVTFDNGDRLKTNDVMSNYRTRM